MINFGSPPHLNFSTSVTVEAWVQLGARENDTGSGLFSNNNNKGVEFICARHTQFALGYNRANGTIEAYMNSRGVCKVVARVDAAPKDWVHVAVVVDGVEAKAMTL